MYVTAAELKASLVHLKDVHPFFGTAYLAFRQAQLPVGETTRVNFAATNRQHLETYFRPSLGVDSFFLPLRGHRPGWVSLEYSRTTLQRIVHDTFRSAFVHPVGTDAWGWTPDFRRALGAHLKRPLPMRWLATWMLRGRPLGEATVGHLCELFQADFGLTQDDLELFDVDASSEPLGVQAQAVAEGDLLRLLPRPPGAVPESGAVINWLSIRNLGPAHLFQYEPGSRVTVITGDNSLGKTFLLEAGWAALTGAWHSCPLMPTVERSQPPTIDYSIAPTVGSKENPVRVGYEWSSQRWKRLMGKPDALPGLAIFARFDGSFAVCDPARRLPDPGYPTPIVLEFSRSEVWRGKTVQVGGLPVDICNGLVRDWVSWQRSSVERVQMQHEALSECLVALSPSRDEPIKVGQPTRVPLDSREVPTVTTRYGPVPVTHASAGVQRILALAYMLVWAWHEHITNSEMLRRQPQRRIILILDEVEAHLHPKWQRVIVPALLRAVEALSADLLPQFHIATHSALVLASLEAEFDSKQDALYHLRFAEDEVKLDDVPFVKRGRADLWLMSDVFGLAEPRGVPAEEAIQDAVALQEADSTDAERVREVHGRLILTLAEDDDFWPRWIFWAEQRGVN